jgi:hypothetical protein
MTNGQKSRRGWKIRLTDDKQGCWQERGISFFVASALGATQSLQALWFHEGHFLFKFLPFFFLGILSKYSISNAYRVRILLVVTDDDERARLN